MKKAFITLSAVILATALSAHASIIQTNTNATTACSSTDLLQTNLASATQGPSAGTTGGWVFTGGYGARDNVWIPLTDGVVDPTVYATKVTTYAGAGNSNWVAFVLDTTTNTDGYDVTQIDFFHGWKDDGRDGMQFQIEIATVADPAAFTTLFTTTKFDPTSNHGSQSISEDSTGVLASGVAAVRVTVLNVDAGWGALDQIDVIGSPTVVPEPATMSLLALGGLVAVRRRRA